jgi:beta-mannosidase
MFSCKFYPFYDQNFVSESKIEVREQVGRLQHHASIIYWVLNNEGEDMTHWGNSGDVTSYMKGYREFYYKTLIPIMKESGIIIEHNFMDTSPTGGVKSFDPYQRNQVSTNSR